MSNNSFVSVFIAIFLFLTSFYQAPASADNNSALVEKVERDSFSYFLKYTPPKTGLTCDSSRSGAPSSIAAVGFYCAVLVVAAENKWLSRKDVQKTLPGLQSNWLRN